MSDICIKPNGLKIGCKHSELIEVRVRSVYVAAIRFPFWDGKSKIGKQTHFSFWNRKTENEKQVYFRFSGGGNGGLPGGAGGAAEPDRAGGLHPQPGETRGRPPRPPQPQPAAGGLAVLRVAELVRASDRRRGAQRPRCPACPAVWRRRCTRSAVSTDQ